MYEISLVSTSVYTLVPHFKMTNVKGNYSVVIITVGQVFFVDNKIREWAFTFKFTDFIFANLGLTVRFAELEFTFRQHP